MDLFFFCFTLFVILFEKKKKISWQFYDVPDPTYYSKNLLNSVINDFFKLKKNMEKNDFKKIIHQVFFIIQLNLFEYEY